MKRVKEGPRFSRFKVIPRRVLTSLVKPNESASVWGWEDEVDRGGEERGAARMGCRVGEEGRFSWPGGRIGLTGQRQRRLVPPGFLLKTRPPFPPAHLAPVSPLSPPPPLSPSLSSLLLLSLPSFTLQFLPLSLFFSLHSSISLTSLVFSPPPCLGHYRHSAAGWEVGVGGCGGGMGRLRGDKSPEMQQSDESDWLWKEAGRPLNAASGQTDSNRQTEETQPFILVL